MLAACGSSVTGRDDPAYDGVLRYCERFAAAAPGRLIDSRGAYYVAGSARVVRPRLGDVVTRLSNMFQPPDSRFVAAWRCRFSISMNGQSCAGEVALPLAEHAEFRRAHQLAPPCDHLRQPDPLCRRRDDWLCDAEVLRDVLPRWGRLAAMLPAPSRLVDGVA